MSLRRFKKIIDEGPNLIWLIIEKIIILWFINIKDILKIFKKYTLYNYLFKYEKLEMRYL